LKLRINALRLTLATNIGPFGATALFDNGLNVIRAENTSGKSALINSMLYALGIEILIGKRGIEATKPVLWKTGDYEGQEFKVIESFVEIEVGNASGDLITVRRYIVGGKDPRLIEVIFGSVVTGPKENQHRVESFFVGMEGAAQRERGFHRFLADFLELELPHVKRFKGEDVPLYVECVAPLMFIEQIRGWSGIQATLPQSFGIRNVAKLAVEYILRLDVIENEKRRIQISEEANRIREDWRGVRELMSQIASQVGGRLMNVPPGPGPVAILTDETWISVSADGEDDIPLTNLLVAKRSLLLECSGEETYKVAGNEEQEARLDSQENELLVVQAELSQLRSDIRSEEDELRKLQDRLAFIKDDIKRNKDIKRLRDLGVETGLSVIHDRCPTCNQSIQDSLIPTESAVMGIEENINFLKTEAEAVALLVSAGKERLSRLKGWKDGKSKAVTNLRSTIRDLRSDLLQTRDMSVAVIREQIHLQEEITRLEQLRDEFDEQTNRLGCAAELWQENRARHSELPDDYFSEEDKKKITAMSKCFAKNVQNFGYRSTGVSQLHISKDNYRPVCDEFEVAFGASASDNIRLIWAYTLALLQVSSSHDGNHWGILVFDEPEQQKMKEASSDALYTEISKINTDEFQVIIATSASVDMTKKRLVNLPHNLLEFGDIVIRPIQD